MAGIVYDGCNNNMVVYAVLTVKPDDSEEFKKVLADFLSDLLQTEIRYLYDLEVIIETDDDKSIDLKEFARMYFSLEQQTVLRNHIIAELQNLTNHWE
jgi:hypothetical protein